MIDTIEILVLILILLVYEYRQQQQIKIVARQQKYKLLLAIFISLAIIVLFWPATIKQWIQISLISVLIFSTGLFRQGLGNNRLITYSALGSGSNYSRFSQIIVAEKPDENGDIEVRFMKTATSSVDVMFNSSRQELISFLSEHVEDQLVINKLSK